MNRELAFGLTLAIAMVACNTSTPEPRTIAHSSPFPEAGCPPTKRSPSGVAKLFCAGTRWTLDGETVVRTDSPVDPSGTTPVETTGRSALTCTVGSVKRLPEAWGSSLACVPELRGAELAMPRAFIATPNGLWARDGDTRVLDEDHQLLAEPTLQDVPMMGGWVDHSSHRFVVEGGGDLARTPSPLGVLCFGEIGSMIKTSWEMCFRDGELVGVHYESAARTSYGPSKTASTWGAIVTFDVSHF